MTVLRAGCSVLSAVLRAGCCVRATGAASCRLVAVLLLALVALASPARASERYDPRLRFRTLSTNAFDIHFHQREDALARRLASIVEEVAIELEPRLGRPHGRVHVILVDQDDVSNGWATPVPFDVIEILAPAPRGGSLSGNTSDWLRLVFVHEYTHILHLDRSRGVFAGLRRVFGRHPFLMPNLYTPVWQIEGLATFEESALTTEGRVNAGDFRLMLNRASAAGRFASLDRTSGGRVDWPSGMTPYLYGAYFHQHLAEKYGDASLRKLADATAGRVPYLGSRAFKEIFGRSLGDLWQEFERDAARDPAAISSPATRLTRHGFIVSGPAYSPDGRLYYSIANPHGFPALMELNREGGERQVTTRVGGDRLAPVGGSIVFDQLDYVRSVAVQSDLYKVSIATGEVRRLTRELRAGDPHVSPDGRTIVCTVQSADRRGLATLPADGNGALRILVSEDSTHYASPRWSPDGRTIVAERRANGAPSELVLIDAAARTIRTLASSPRGRNVNPSWTPDGRGVLFASDREGGSFQAYLVDVDTGGLRRLINAGASADSPVLSPDGQSLVFVGYTNDGFDLFALQWVDAEWQQVAAGVKDEAAPRPASDGSEPADEAEAGRPYRPGRQLWPRFWTPTIESDGDETSFGAATAGSDALGRHSYAVGGAWSTAGRPDWYAAYVYDRWRPSVFANTSDDRDSWLEGEVRTRELNVGVAVPFRTVRHAQSVFGALHVSNERFDCAACAPAVDASIERRALRAGWSFTTAKEYGYSISAEEGLRASIAAETSPEGLGATGTASTLVADLRAYIPAAPRHGIVALRGAAAGSWGDDDAVRVFGATGSGAQSPVVGFGRDAIGLIRGFADDDVIGARAVVVNADYRLPLAWIERGVGTWPLLLRSLHAAAFVDAGAAWNERLTDRRRRTSAGLELSADVVLGYFLPVTFASGVAWRHDPTGIVHGPAFFARVGRAF